MNTRTPLNPALAALATELFAFAEIQLDQPTENDRQSLMRLRSKIKDFDRSGLSGADATDLSYLYVEATRCANRQENYLEKNDYNYAVRAA